MAKDDMTRDKNEDGGVQPSAGGLRGTAEVSGGRAESGKAASEKFADKLKGSRHYDAVFGATDKTHVQLLRNLCVGVVALGVDFGLLWLLTDVLGVYYLFSNVVSVLMSGLISFALNSIWVFHKRDKTAKNTFLRFLAFTAVGALGLLINMAVLWMFTDLIGLHYMFSKAIAQVVSFLFNFFVRKVFVFERG